MSDARISTALPAHPKTKKLIRRLGQVSGWNLVCLFLWVAANRPDGNLSGMSDEDIELSADWQGDAGAFVAALVEVRFIDGDPEEYLIHDWAEHNPWAAGAEMRSAKARWNAAKRHHGIAEADRIVPEYAAIRIADSNATSITSAQYQQPTRNAPSPSPSPSPSEENCASQASAPEKQKRTELISAKTIREEIPELEEQTVIDYLAVRKAKRAPMTRTAWDSIKKQILITQQRFGIPPNQSLGIAVLRNWQGFEADWVAKHLGIVGNETNQQSTGRINIDHNDTSWADNLEIPIGRGS